ncbi:glycosyltransferase [Mucilaginibacter litoreus]|uniref:Glycosyltransferase n=1 Tax=Mucilaginibacter litoreus TaxID=1048221 RepID=A0ABW3AVX3_9SPHI
MKKLLIISPYFPPVNAADMQRVRMSLPYFKEFGWQAEVVRVDEEYTDMPTDILLNESIPADIKIHCVKAFDKARTSRLGLGSIALRSLWFYLKRVNQLLKTEKFDLIYFSTTQFPVCVLGAYWKKRFDVPYVIDMQDPWHSEYYRDKPKEQQPPKYWFSYRLNKYTEPIAMKHVGGLISVSEAYINDLKERYPQIKNIPADTITFGSFLPDMQIADRHKNQFTNLLSAGFKNIVYIGRGGKDMHSAICPLFEAFKSLLNQEPSFYNKFRFYFIGTSYAPKGKGQPTILPLAEKYGLAGYVTENTDRISHFHTLVTLQQADALFIPGSDDPKYTASKIYPYLLTKKPLLAIFNANSPAIKTLIDIGVKHAYTYNGTMNLKNSITGFFKDVLTGNSNIAYNDQELKKYSAYSLTQEQCELFNQVLTDRN